MELIFKIRDSGLAVVVIEHDMRFIFNLCDRVLCLVRRARSSSRARPARCSPTRGSIEAYIGTGPRRSRRAEERGGAQ